MRRAASWLGGLLAIFPPIALVGLLIGLYSLYLFFVGLPKLMKPPADKAVTYAIVVIVVAIVVFIVIGIIAGVIIAAVTPAQTLTGLTGIQVPQ